MCGRFALTLPRDAVAGWFDAVQVKTTLERPRYNFCPSQRIPVLVTHNQQRQLVDMRWGFIPHWFKKPNDGPLLINARCETLSIKPAFCAATKSRRCLIPASGFYEWHRTDGQKHPWYFSANSNELIAFAGIWQAWQGQQNQRIITCAMITTEAGNEMSAIHHREPVVVQPNEFGLWLGEEGHGAAKLMRNAEAGFYQKHRVSMAVNSGREDYAALMEPLAD